MNLLDALSLFASIALFVGYHRFLARRLTRDPYYTVHALNNFARMRWVESVMQSDRADVLAVQTLRNSVMASSFMASTAILHRDPERFALLYPNGMFGTEPALRQTVAGFGNYSAFSRICCY